MSQRDRTALLAGEAVVGEFQVAGTDGIVPGVLYWSAEVGATLELIGEAPSFPRSFGHPPFEVHGVLRNGGDVTLLDCMLRRLTMFDRPTHVSSSALAFGAHVLPDTRWPRAVYSTAALSEWRNDSAFHFPMTDPAQDPFEFRIAFRDPVRDVVKVPGAELTFTGNLKTSTVGHRPDFWARTTAVMVVNANRSQSVSTLMTRYAQPLRALMALAADRPDDLIREVYVDLAKQRQIEVWRRGRTIREEEWNFRYLFTADDLLDYPRAIRAWWRLQRQVWPALDLLGDHANEGSHYSPGRFLTAFSALERYGDIRHRTTDLRKLRSYGGIDSSLTGCTNRALELIAVTRGYVTHFNNVDDKRRAEVEANVLKSTRRVAALMQSCLLRNLGIKKRHRHELMTQHYMRWPLT
ncbi:MAG TPA: hypothetical protein VGO48_11445 [Conexibacter sp.]|nr:hypothetical protein [Conexibacter sp.]